MIHFTSDWHLYHTNILKYCDRPFKTIEEMHEVILHNWNRVVKKGDTVYVLGDVTYGNKENTLNFIKKPVKRNMVFYI